MEEQPHAIAAELVAILQKQALVDALFCVFLASVGLCLEGGDEESVRCTWNDDVAIALYKGKGLGIVPERQVGEASEGLGELWEIFLLLLVVIVGGGGRGCGSMGGRGGRVEDFVGCRLGCRRLGCWRRVGDRILDRGRGRFRRDVLERGQYCRRAASDRDTLLSQPSWMSSLVMCFFCSLSSASRSASRLRVCSES